MLVGKEGESVETYQLECLFPSPDTQEFAISSTRIAQVAAKGSGGQVCQQNSNISMDKFASGCNVEAVFSHCHTGHCCMVFDGLMELMSMVPTARILQQHHWAHQNPCGWPDLALDCLFVVPP